MRHRITTSLPPARLRQLAERVHALGPWPLFCALRELDDGGDLHRVLENYAAMHSLRHFIRELGGAEMPPPRVIKGSRR